MLSPNTIINLYANKNAVISFLLCRNGTRCEEEVCKNAFVVACVLLLEVSCCCLDLCHHVYIPQ